MLYASLGRVAAARLLKLAVHPGVKQYRRVMQGLEEGLRSMKGRSAAREGLALHGTDDIAGILEDSRIYASQLGETGQHGGGVYWWRGFPREGYLSGPESEGIISSLKDLPDKKPMMRNIYSGHANPQAVRTGPGDYRLQRKDMAVMDTPRRAPEGYVEMAQEQGLRPVDSAIFDQAMKDFKVKNQLAAGHVPERTPMTDKEIIELYKKRVKPRRR